MLLRPHPEVLHPLEGIHGPVLLVKNHPRRSGGSALTSRATAAGASGRVPSSEGSRLPAFSLHAGRATSQFLIELGIVGNRRRRGLGLGLWLFQPFDNGGEQRR